MLINKMRVMFKMREVIKQRNVVLLITVFILSGFGSLSGQESYNCKFYNAYISGDMSAWPEWIDDLEREYRRHESDEVLKDLVVAYYGYVAWLIGVEREDEADNYMEQGEDYINKLSETPGYKSYAQAMQGAFLAYEVSMNMGKALYLGTRSLRYINRAIEEDPDNPYAWIEKGNAEYHMPRAVGGSYKEAAENYQKAVKLLEQDTHETECNWVYLNALAWQAQSYDKAGDRNKAHQTYEKIINLESDFEWVRDELYPEFRGRKK
ncbi:MAG: hypothetical protein ACLFUH_01615 [Bacteroidales bacterium]